MHPNRHRLTTICPAENPSKELRGKLCIQAEQTENRQDEVIYELLLSVFHSINGSGLPLLALLTSYVLICAVNHAVGVE
jgi:hypothetical protein